MGFELTRDHHLIPPNQAIRRAQLRSHIVGDQYRTNHGSENDKGRSPARDTARSSTRCTAP
jgi:hypothetical protein